ncbi:hypothetical protein EW145_g3287 [Phellinidium pouzarii]|uniref:PAN2-PAN3 deadenylation complex subunit PAN3 n=1 Tax=Phellinidium pouzarii TaxID=167371 RepID=A0A4S4L958_9AGAM|nr:hypothetical protein EW145_g3287 [Phellinidium pouzarii]
MKGKAVCISTRRFRGEIPQIADPASTQDEENGIATATFPAQAVNAPVFVPRSVASPQRTERAVASPPPSLTGGNEMYDLYEHSEPSPDSTGRGSLDGLVQQVEYMNFADYGDQTDDHMLMQQDYNGVSMDPFYQPQQFIRHPLDYHLYTLPVPTTEGRKFFISDNIREELLRRAERMYMGAPPGLPLPEEVQGYHSLVPLEIASPDKKKFGSWNSTVYKAIKISDGRAYVLRRIENFRLMNEQAFGALDKWTKIRHPNIVSVREAFTSRAFGDNSLVVAYDFHPNGQSLADAHFKKTPYQGGRVQSERISEATLWTYIFQIASAMKVVHEAGLAVRMVDASKILITGQNRLRISSCAIFDILLYDSRQDQLLMQQEDMIMFAKLIMSLACNNPSAVSNVHKSLDQIHRAYPGAIKDVIHFLMKTPGPMKNIQGLFDAFGGKLVTELDAAHTSIDSLEGELMGELENARLVRLLCKFGFINERPEFDRDPRWSETGDRYIIKLFRDYVFHSVDENGNPVMNLGHVLTNLNKLDAGSDERLMLVSRDEQSCLVVTYREVRNCIEAAFSCLLSSTFTTEPRVLEVVVDHSRHSDTLMTSYARNHAPVNISPGVHSHQHPHFASGPSQHMPVHGHGQRRHRFVTDLSQCLLDFVVQLLPTAEELAVKEDVRKLLERLIRTIEVDSRLLSFGSTANGFSLRNSDMDLCCLIDSEERLSATDLVTMVGDLLERETKFHVKPLPHARIPIVKLSLDPSPGLPLGIACDIGFENRLALENTRLLLCYSMVDPTRVRTLVLFLKVWSKRRKINSPYQGTLSSYGYVLLVIYFLVHVKNPPVLPNLQQIPPLRPIPAEEYHMGERNIWFFDDIELLRQKWKSSNTESVAELLIDFFRYYARDFSYNTGVASIRAGLLKKDVKGWQNDTDPRFKDGRERNRLCIEDPFEVDYNVARCVTKDGLYLIRGEFMRASRILQVRPERAYYALAQLCEERDESVMKLTAAHNTLYVPPRLSFPPQTPYSIGSNSFRPNSTSERERLSPLLRPLAEDTPTIPPHVHSKIPPEHMAPKRTKWTSPPPPEAPDADRSSFESRLGFGLSLATAATDARELEKAYQSSSSNSEILSDDGDIHSDIALDDDVKSVRSFTGEPSTQLLLEHPEEARLPFSPSSSVPHRLSEVFSAGAPLYMMYQQAKTRSQIEAMPTSFAPTHAHGKSDGLRRSNSGPARAGNAAGPRVHLSPSAQIPLPFNVPLPPSPVHTAPHSATSSPTIYYETNVHRMPNAAYTTSSSTPSSPVNPPPMYQQQYHVAHAHAQAQAQAYGQSHQVSEVSSSLARSMDDSPGLDRRPTKPADSKPASPMMQSPSSPTARPLHVHTHSNSTIVGPRTPAASSFSLAQIQTQSTSSLSQQSSPSHSPSFPHASLMRLPALPAISSNYTSPRSIIPSAYGSSPRLFSANVSSPQPGSPHLSSHLPHLERRQSQSGISSQSVQSQAQLPVSGLSTTTGASLAFDLASPAVSPVSSASASSHGGSASGSASIASVSAGSGGSKSPFSSTSPRAADLSSPRAPSPERRLHKQAHELPPHPHQPSHREHNSQSQYQHSHNQSHPSFGVPRPGKITRPVRARVPLTSGREDATPGETERTNESGLSEVLSPRSPCLPRAHPNAPQGTEQSGSVEREVSPISEPAVSGSQEFKLAVDTEGHRVVEKASESLMSTSEVTESMGEERVSESVEKILVQAH